jgi:hypothetical protein
MREQQVFEDEDVEAQEDLEDDDDDLGDDDEPEAAAAPDDDDDSDETSLDELLSQRAATRKGKSDEPDEEDDIMALSSESRNPTGEPLPTRVIPLKDRKEFVCSNCHLVKARSQLADAERGLCRDCV